MKQDLLEILVDIFKSCGYSVTKSSRCDILVEKNGHQAYVRYALRPDYDEIKVFSEMIEGCTGIYVMTQKTSGDLINYAAELGIHIWDRDELALQIGRVVLINMEQKTKSPCTGPETQLINEISDPSRKSTFELQALEKRKSEEALRKKLYFSEKPEPPQKQQQKIENASSEARSLLWDYEEWKNSNEFEQVKQQAEQQAEFPKVDSYEMLNIHSIEPKVSKDQAIIIAKPYVSNPKDAVLKFVPFWKYSYKIEVEKKFRSRVLSIAGEGKGLLNALNKSREETKIEGFGVPTRVPAGQYEVKRPNIDRKQAQKIILDLIIEENTREMRFNNMDGQAIIYEVRSLSPRPEEVELDIELVYIPVWEVKGKRNSLEINAYNAKVLEQPMDEDAEFL
jgi:hypothetical protein